MIFGTVGQVAKEDFTVVDSAGILVTGLIDGNFTRKLYNPSGTEVSGSVTITITELGNGNYRATYTPNAVGIWYMSVYHATYFPWGKNGTTQAYNNDFDSIDSTLDNIVLSINDMTSSLDGITTSLDNITLSINDMTSSLDNIVLSINDMTSSLETLTVSMDNVVLSVNDMTSTLENITTSLSNVSDSVDVANVSLDNVIDTLDDVTDSLDNTTSSLNNIIVLITRSLGLSQENHYLDNTTYDDNNNLTRCRIRIYSNASDVGSGSNIIATYLVTAEYTGELLDYYKVVKQ